MLDFKFSGKRRTNHENVERGKVKIESKWDKDFKRFGAYKSPSTLFYFESMDDPLRTSGVTKTWFTKNVIAQIHKEYLKSQRLDTLRSLRSFINH